MSQRIVALAACPLARYAAAMLRRIRGTGAPDVASATAIDFVSAPVQRPAANAGEPIHRAGLSNEKHERLDLRHRHFNDLNANKSTFINFDFSYSVFTRAYLRSATFEKCNFVGCRFYDSNLRGTSLRNCDFKYATFYRTLVESKEILAVLPGEPNLRRDSLQNLRANAVEVGDYGSQRLFVLAEIDAAIDHLSRSLKGSEDYYRRKYPGFSDKLWAALALGRLKTEGWVWGHGERPLRMLGSACILILALTLVNFWSVVPRVGWGATRSGWELLRYNIDLLFGATTPKEQFRGFVLVDYALVAMRYVYIGLFISVLSKSISHR